MPSITRRTALPATPAQALAISLDLDLELQVGRMHRLRIVDTGPGCSTGGAISDGQTVTWSGRLWGWVPASHTSVIAGGGPPDGAGTTGFTDSMVRGVFVHFRHQHTFEPAPPGCVMLDEITWRSPLGALGLVADVLFVRSMLAALVDQRNAAIVARCGQELGEERAG